MSYTTTPALSLKKDNADEPIINLRTHNNDNLDAIDTTVGNLVKAINNAKVLLGQLVYDQTGQPVVSASTARANLDAAQSENAAGSLYDAEQAIGTNASAIASLQDSVLQVHSVANPFTFASGYSGESHGHYAGLLKAINFKITPSSQLTVGTKYSVGTVASALVPRGHTSVFALHNNDYVYVDISGEGRVDITPKTGDVTAGTNIWIRHTYW